MELVRMILAVIFITTGVVMEIIAVFGLFKLDYVLPRMHAAAIGDTGALGCVMVGLMIASGFNLFTLKLLLIWAFLWMGSAVTSHVLSRMIVTAEKEEMEEHTEVIDVEVDKL